MKYSTFHLSCANKQKTQAQESIPCSGILFSRKAPRWFSVFFLLVPTKPTFVSGPPTKKRKICHLSLKVAEKDCLRFRVGPRGKARLVQRANQILSCPYVCQQPMMCVGQETSSRGEAGFQGNLISDCVVYSQRPQQQWHFGLPFQARGVTLKRGCAADVLTCVAGTTHKHTSEVYFSLLDTILC